MVRRSKRVIWAVLLAGLLGLVAWDRSDWAEVAQWREDQACNLWIGYSRDLFNIPVGLISSVGTPNPNGMPLLGAVLSKLPNLWAISTVLGVTQGALVIWVCWLMTGPRLLFFVLALPTLCSVILRATSVEFWNQWILTTVNLAFFGAWLTYVRKPSWWPVVGCIALMLYAPAIYLAGLLNAVVFFLLVAAALILRPPEVSMERCLAPALASFFLCVFALVVTWVPYSHAMDKLLLPVPAMTLDVARSRIVSAVEATLEFPHWSVVHWYRNAEQSFLQGDGAILRSSQKRQLGRTSLLLFVQASLALTALAIAVARWSRPSRTAKTFFTIDHGFLGLASLASLTFVLLSVGLGPLLGAPDWVNGERPDQQVPFLPFLMFAWFALPFALNLPVATSWVLRGSTVLFATWFCVLSLRLGEAVVFAHLSYRGSSLTHADVPLQSKREAIAFIAHDWMATSTAKWVPVSYRHGENWVTEFGKQLDPWYPAPMTVGRAFDFELSRVYGLTNTQEGQHTRAFKKARYVITYAFDPPIRQAGMIATKHDFGRVRVTVLTP